ncbi:TlpA disulfide reductase family protein [Pedobacter frigidisoli]|uniref:TlpA family protein disulfide reductase n=1 Tax=Pedobacter frigidisoli TaxID=2530455 RepID=UPI00292E50DF|nr:TlpA disulfide reductase family protein [Pedobacter frigidisoli]
MKKYTYLLILVMSTLQLMAQQNDKEYPEVGKPMPDFKFTNVKYADQKTLTKASFAGKWFVLDGWNRHCSICLHKMPILNQMKAVFKDSVRFLLVGYNGSLYSKAGDDKAIRELFEMNRKEQDLTLAIAYDSVMFHRFNIGACPFMIIVDPKGIVRAVTTGFTSADLKNLMNNKPVVSRKAYRRDEIRTK